MCVIALCEKKPSKALIEDMYHANDHGGGIAWREIVRGKPVVKWKKGLDLEEMIELINSEVIVAPFAAHFRIATCGPKGRIYPPLCHPFPIALDAPITTSGSTSNPVLFHNGVWHGWENKVLEFALRGGYKIPEGIWSDSRALAWAAANLGLGFLEFSREKTLVYGPTQAECWMTSADSWTFKYGMWTSNTGWDRKTWTSVGNKRETTDKEDHTQTSPSVGPGPGTASSSGQPQQSSQDLKQGTGGSSQGSPFFSPEGKIVVEMGDHMMRWAEVKHSQKGTDGRRLLSKGQIRKLRRAHAKWRANLKIPLQHHPTLH